ncbi:MAG: exodeoxyribonuclease III [Bifidobacteriaceae bacterium]|jgi:exodeoxyribonuclease-3|nr:exodeoxyribonuclease III [Bifidobacteriaceae bacterium]
MALDITSLNVGGIRAAMRKGMGPWLRAAAPDVLCLQEVRAPAEVLDPFLPGRANHQAVSELKGRSGVAVSSLLEVARVRSGLDGIGQLDTHTGRWLEADLLLPGGGELTVVSAYVHSGEVGTERQDHKLDFLQVMTKRLEALGAAGKPTVVCGDFNVAHREADLKNWKGNLKNSGFLPEERAILTSWFADLGWVDVGRALAGEREGPYTWWSWRGKAFDNDTGWRIDYQIATPDLAAKAVDFRIDKPERYDARWTDHAPFTVTYDLPGFTPA